MGRHANVRRRRGLAPWLRTLIVVVVVAAIAVAGYLFVLNNSDDGAQGVCSQSVTLQVTAGPSAAPALRSAADAYNDTKPVVRSNCVAATVTSVADATALAGLTGQWPTDSGSPPGLWVPDSAASLAALDAVRPDLAAGHPTKPVAWSPVVLAVPEPDAPTLDALAWSDLMSANSDGHVPIGDRAVLSVTFPLVLPNPASGYALQSALAGAVASTPIDTATVAAHVATIRNLAGGDDIPKTTSGALAELAGRTPTPSGEASAVFAVPAVEADLVRFDTQSSGGTLAAVHPSGSTVGDALIAAPITASWTNRTLTSAASDFQAYLSDVAGQQILADHGWRTISAHPAHPLDAVDTQAEVAMVPAAGPSVDRALAVALEQAAPPATTTAPPATSASTSSTTATTPTTSPATTTAPTTTTPPATTTAPSSPTFNDSGPVLTLIVDTSAGMKEEVDGKSLLQWVQQAVPQWVDGTLTDRVGLWVYSDAVVYPPSGFPELVSTGPLGKEVTIPKPGTDDADDTVTEPRTAALPDAINAVTATGDRWAYGALMEALQKVPDAAVDDRASRVILITSGVDQTPGTPRRMVIDAVKAVDDVVRVDVIGLGDAVPVEAYSDIATAAGGEYYPAPEPKDLGQQIIDLLTLGD